MLGFVGVIVGAVLAGGFQWWFDNRRSKREYAEARRREKVTAYSEALGTLSPFTSAIQNLAVMRGVDAPVEALLPSLETMMREHQTAAGALYRARLVTPQDQRLEADTLIEACLALNRDRTSFDEKDREEMADVTRRLLNFLQDELDRTIPAKP